MCCSSPVGSPSNGVVMWVRLRRERESFVEEERKEEEDGEVAAVHWAVFKVFKIILFTPTPLDFYFDPQMSNFFTL